MRKNRETATAAAAPAGTAGSTAAALPADAVTDAVPADAAAAYSVAAGAPAYSVDAVASAAAVSDAVSADGIQGEQDGQDEQDPAGGITLSGRSRAGMRARVLTGVMVTAGLVACVGGPDTVSSFRLTSVW